jgi:hypothetical protein
MAWILGTANDEEIKELDGMGVIDLMILTKEQTEGVFKSIYGPEGFSSEDYKEDGDRLVIYWLDCDITNIVATD